jgi:hypothetical protein
MKKFNTVREFLEGVNPDVCIQKSWGAGISSCPLKKACELNDINWSEPLGLYPSVWDWLAERTGLDKEALVRFTSTWDRLRIGTKQEMLDFAIKMADVS